ncbi:hypothetical protein [Staphylococcus epidermidis]|uniref:restriction endonuclease n=1 Tax=Staphylococcus epidermidis TaxID=1282 RepID=UPI00338E429C
MQQNLYFIAETKGASDNISLNLKGVENAKIESARQHFKVISNNEVTYVSLYSIYENDFT